MEKVIDIFNKFVVWLVLFMVISLSWVGAEYIFEGTVHSSEVDGAVAALLAYNMMLAGRKNENTSEMEL